MNQAPATKIPTMADVRRYARSPKVKAAQLALIAARAFAQVTREKVDAYIAPVFAAYAFTDEHTGEPITTPRDLYRTGPLQETECARFYAACDEAHRANGYQMPVGHCPALTAEHLETKAENNLLRAALAAMEWEPQPLFGELRKMALDLFSTMPKGTP